MKHKRCVEEHDVMCKHPISDHLLLAKMTKHSSFIRQHDGWVGSWLNLATLTAAEK